MRVGLAGAGRIGAMHASVLAALDGGPATPFEVARRVFPEDLTDHQLRFALAETLAHLEHLEGEDYVQQVADGVVSYQAV